MQKSVSPAVLKKMKTDRGRSLYEISEDHPVLLVFLRYFGCSFCREAMDDLSRIREKLNERGVQLICVHMDSHQKAERFFKKYKLKDIEHISDTNQQFYKVFGLVKGSFQQLFGLKNMLRGFDAAIIKGHGVSIPKPIGDGFQMPGVFLIDNGQVLSEYIHRMASDRPDYLAMVD